MQAIKSFAEKLKRCLDDMEAPPSLKDRADILSKMVDVPRQEAWSWLEGRQMPKEDGLQKIAVEFDVDLNWLVGMPEKVK